MKPAFQFTLLFGHGRKRFLSLLFALVCTVSLQAQANFNYAEYFFDTDPGIGNGNAISAPLTADSVTITLPAISTAGLGTGNHTLFVRSRTDGIKWSLYQGSSFFIKPSITFAEYFIDTDPGVGNGTSLPVTADEDSISISAAITTGILSGGTHRLYIRTRDNAGNYSLHEGQPFFVTSSTSLSAAEWFIDTDPGIGNGIPVAISGTDSADYNGTIVTPNNLTGGTHFLYVRAKTQTGKWGLYEPKPFFVTSQTTLSAAEWFIDTDPGIGNGTALSINGLDSASFTGSIVTPNNLTGGTHFLYVRAKTQTGKWGLYEPKPFFVTSQTTLAAAEWFIDTDPGIGNGTALYINGLDSASFTGSIVTPNNLTGGTHFLYVRAKTLTGKWSLYEPKPFFVNLATTINAAEYFIDTDPGIGNGTPITVTPGLDSITGSAAIVIPNNLKAGNHYLYLRTRSLPGKWSLYEGRKFTVKPSIVAAEYFVDNDPGIGNANPITITPGFDSVTVTTTMATACLALGEHYVYLRAKDSNGNWGLYEPDTINVTGTTPVIFTPGNDTICLGDSVTLTLNANTACSLQWFLNSAPIPGATNVTYLAYVSGLYQLKQTTGGIDYVSNALNITVLPNCAPSVWTGNSSTNWFTPGNWNTGVVPNSCTSDVVIPTTPSGAVFPDITTGSPQVHDINVQNGATISIAAYSNLSVCGNWKGGITTASSVNGTVSLTGTSAQQLSGRTSFQTLRLSNSAGATMQASSFFDVFVALELQTGAFSATNGTLTFKSNSSSQAAVIDNFSSGFNGTLIGPINYERSYDAAPGSYGNHLMGSPVNSISVSQFGAAGTSGIAVSNGCDETALDAASPWSSMSRIVESNGTGCGLKQTYFINSGNIQNAEGYWVQKTGAGKITLTGDANLDISYSRNDMSNSGWATNSSIQGRLMGPGWGAVSNPYPAYMNTALIAAQTNFDAQKKVWHTTGAFANSYQDANILAPGQAMMVHRNAVGTNGTYTVALNTLTRTPLSTTFYQQANDQTLTILAQNISTQLLDKTTVAFNTDATIDFDAQYDGDKLPGSLNRHTLFTHNANPRWLSTNVLKSITDTSTVPMGFEPGTTGSYVFTFEGLASFDPTSYVTLEDLKLNSFHDIRSGNYNFIADSADNWNRFVLHFTPAAEVTTVNQNCDTQGVINVTQPGIANWEYIIENSNSATLGSGILNINNPVTLYAPVGVYTLTLIDANIYTVVKNVTVNGIPSITAALASSTTTAETGDDITFTCTTPNTETIEWNMNDGSIFHSPIINYQYQQAGTYTVTLTVTNADGCISTTAQIITVTQKIVSELNNITNKTGINIWSNENHLFIDFSKQAKVNATIEIYNMLGQQLINEKFTRSTLYTKPLNNLEAAYLIVRVNNEGEVKMKKVFITNE